MIVDDIAHTHTHRVTVRCVYEVIGDLIYSSNVVTRISYLKTVEQLTAIDRADNLEEMEKSSMSSAWRTARYAIN